MTMVETRSKKRPDLSVSPSPSPSPSPPPPPAPELEPPLKQVSTDIGPASAAAREALSHLRRALADRTSYKGLLLLNIAAPANKAVKRLVASLSEGPTYKISITGPHPDRDDIARALWALDDTIAPGATLYLTIADANPETVKFRLGVDCMTRALNDARPDVKLVFAALSGVTSLKSENALPELEVRDLRTIPWDLAAEAERLRVDRLLYETKYDLAAARATPLLAGLAPASARQALGQAKILGKRRRDAGEAHTDTQNLADLADAVESLYARSGKRPKPTAAANDTSYVQAFLRPDLQADSPEAAVAGLPEAVKQFILTLKRCAAMRGVVPKIKRTMLLKGPPGTGKTTVARAIAAELGYPCLAPKSSAFVNEYIGKSANNVYRFFEQARAYADMRGTPVVIFFDEIDALLKKRSSDAQSGEREYDRIVNAFLESLEGIDGGADDRLIIIGATNFSGTLDNAGFDRFSVKAELALPDVSLLAAIYRVHLEGRAHSLDDADIGAAAALSIGLSGRHVVNILDKAGILAFESGPDGSAPCITGAHIREAVRIISSETETAYIQTFLRRPQQAKPTTDVLADVPREIGRFVRMIPHLDALQKVVPDANKSLLLFGKPGTGKTTLARAMADEMQLPLLAPTAAALMGKFHGESAENVNRLFAQARVYARAHDTQVMIFLDDLDALVVDRNAGGSEHRAMLGALLENLRGIDPAQNQRLVFVGATNAAGDLDPAVRDRFHLRVQLKAAEGAGLRRIFLLHLQKRNHTVTQEQLQGLMGLAHGFSGRSVVEAINRAGYIAQESAKPGIAPSIDAAALRGGIVEELRQCDKDGNGPPPEHMYI